jgi:hypothetical protein
MDGVSRTCLGCQAELRPNARFCPRCGQAVSADQPAPADPVPGNPGPGSAPPEQPDGPGLTIAAQPALPLPAPGFGMPAATGWGEPTATQPPVYPVPAPSYPPPAHQRPAYGQAPEGVQNFEPFRPYQPAVPPAGPPPRESSLEPLPGSWRQPPRRHDGNRPGISAGLWVTLLVVLLGGGATAVLLIAHPFSHPALSETANSGTGQTLSPGGTASASAASGATSPVSPTASASAAAVNEQQAATSVASMLSQSVSDRAAIISASNDVGTCGPNLASDPKVFDDAASSRQSLLASLTAMPGLATLPPALISDLTNAWQASIAADQAYAKWANDEIAQGCVPNDTSDPGYLETETPNTNATKYKTAFVAQWNPIAAQYGLTQYQQGQL